MAKQKKSAEDIRYATREAGLVENKHEIDIWGLTNVFGPICMIEANQVLACQILYARLKLPYETKVNGSKLEIFYTGEHPVKIIFSLDFSSDFPNQMLNIAAEYEIRGRVCCEFTRCIIGTFFEKNCMGAINECLSEIMNTVRKFK